MNNDKDKTNIWLDIEKVSELIGLSVQTIKRHCRQGEFIYKIVKRGKSANYSILLKSLPEYAQEKYIGNDNIDLNYSDAPNWSKQQAEKYITIINETKGLKGEELKKFIQNWNSINDECYKTSYSSLIKMRKRYFRYGINGLLSQHGKHLKGSSVPDKYFDYFKSLYLVEGAPSLRSCWVITLGYAIRIYNEDKKTFPSYMAFKRRLDKEVPKSSIYLAREGQAAWNRKYGNYIDRDYSNITCNQVWVSDHAQIDVACFDSENRVVFPWVTVWRDFKSGKWLGWLLHTASPNSDHIFQSFYFAAQEHGLPKDVIIDNGKDYRSKDFAGGRKNSDQNIKTSSMLKELDVDVHFALPYNAQTKPIERDFLKIKELLSKHCIGYRGGNVVERPEKLNKEIKLGKLMTFDNFKNIFDPQMFWYKNNGLSIVCKRFEPKEIGGRISLEIESPYIVNGGQTAKTIYNYYLDNKDNEEAMSPLYKAFVMARVYQTTNEQEINEIVQGTNTQNKITLFDLKSSKPNLKLYKEYFSQHNISLLIERNIEESKMAKSINSDKLLQLYCSIYKEIPHKAKISIGKLIENYYDEVYDTPDIYNELLNSFLIYDFVINENKKHNEEHLSHSAFSLIYLICKIDPSLKENVDKHKLLISYNKAIELVNEIVTNLKNNDTNYTPHNFFKSEYSTKCINDKLIKKTRR